MSIAVVDYIPLWVLFLLTCALSVIALELGFRLGMHHGKTKVPLDSMVAAMFGLLAFILAFTFGLAATRFDNKRTVVLEEANAIGTTYLRSQYLPKPYNESIPPKLKEYVVERLNAVKTNDIDKLVQKSTAIREDLWKQTISMVNEGYTSDVYALYIESLNEIINLHSKRTFLIFGIRVPNILWIILFLLLVLSFGSMGYISGFRECRNIGVSLLIIIAFSSVIYLIADLEKSQEGFIRVSQQPLKDVLEMIQIN